MSNITTTASSSSSISLQEQFNNPLVRDYELNENSTHYDKLVAAPSDEDLLQMWSAWSITLYSFAVFSTSVFFALVCTPSVRHKPFNLFLIYLMIPDILAMWLCGTSCLINAIAGHYTSVGHCRFQSFYLTVAIGANAWLNAAITRHLLTMLRSAKNFQKYKPPSRLRVTMEAIGVYLYTMLLASLFLFESDWWPFKTRLSTGVVCIPVDYDTTSTIFLYAVFLPLWFLIPLFYVCYATVVIYRQNLMPKTGRRRTLAIYFFRLVLVFLIMWVPCLLLMFVTSAWTNPWVQWAGGFWGHLQGAVSAVASLMKPDIWDAFVEFYKPLYYCCCCCFCKRNYNAEGGMQESMEEKAIRRGYYDATSTFNSTPSSLHSSVKKSISALGNKFATSRIKKSFDEEVAATREIANTFTSSEMMGPSSPAVSASFASESIQFDSPHDYTPTATATAQQESIAITKGGDVFVDEENPDLLTSQTSTNLSFSISETEGVCGEEEVDTTKTVDCLRAMKETETQDSLYEENDLNPTRSRCYSDMASAA